jgi:hypothetical protein
MRGDDRFYFRRLAERDASGSWSAQVEQAKDAAARARIDALRTGDGTYELLAAAQVAQSLRMLIQVSF